MSGHGGARDLLTCLVTLLLLGGCAPTGSPPTALRAAPPGTTGVASPAGFQPPRVTITGAAATPPGRAVPSTSGVAGPSSALATSTGTPGPATPAPDQIGHPLVLTGPTGPVGLVAWAPDGARFATATGFGNAAPDTAVHLWRADGTPLATLTGHTAPVYALAWAPDGRTLASGGADHTVRLWRADGAPLATIAPAPDSVFSLAWSPDGRLLAVGSIAIRPPALPGTVRLYHPDGRPVATLAPTLATGGKFLPLAWSPDGRLLAAGAIAFQLWRADGAPLAAFGGGVPAPALAWAPDGATLALGDENGDVALYDAAGQRLATLEARGSVRDLAFSPDGATLAIITDGAVLFADPANWRAAPRAIYLQGVYEQPGQSAHTQSGVVSNLAWSPDGARLAAATADGVLRVWRADGAPLATYAGCPGAIERVAWSPDGAELVAGSRDQVACLWR